jgi:DNA uptake protein ComE-like DNA-binding protein
MEREAKSPDRSMAVEKTAKKPTKAVVKPVGKTSSKAKAEPKTASKAGTASVAKTVPAATLDLTPTQQDKLLALLNEGTAVELAAISGIAATRAGAIVGARPFQNVHEVILVPGVGEATFDRIIKHGKTLTRTAAKSAKS